MRHERANGVPGPATAGPLSAPFSECHPRNSTDVNEQTFDASKVRSIAGVPVTGALAAGLTPPSRRGERSPMTPSGVGEGDLPGGPGSPLPYDVAAVLCGHDITTEAGAEAARHDYRVWDLAEELQP